MKMNKYYKTLQDFSINFIYIFAAIIFSIFFITSLFITTKIPDREFPEYILFNYSWIFFFILQILIVFLIIRYNKKINSDYLFLILAGIFLIYGMYIILNINNELRADAEVVWQGAIDFSNNSNYLFLKGRYFDFYPHQLGLLHYERLIMGLLGTNPRILFTINLLQVISINYILYRIVDLISNKNHIMNLLSIILSFLFLPQFYFIVFAYGLINGLFFAIIGIYFLVKYQKNKKVFSIFLSATFISIACLLRNNYIILFLAIVIYLIFINYKHYKKMAFIFTITFFMLSKLFTYSINSMTENKTGNKFTNGAPKQLWIAMGTDPENWNLGPGWYNGYVRDVISSVNYDYDKAKIIGNQKIKQNIKHFIFNPVDAVNYFTIKIASTWLEPSFQSFWTGPQKSYKQITENKIISSIYNQGNLYKLNFNFMKANLVLSYAAIAFYLWKYRNKEFTIFILYFLGGFIFHIFWETKAQYVYPYIYLILPIVAASVKNVFSDKKSVI